MDGEAIMDMNLQKYAAFVKSVEYGSFTKAADILSYSQSGISRMIRDLEEEWKLSLLERGKNGVIPTSDGLRLLPYAAALCHDFDKLQREVNALNGLETGLIRIGTFSSIATHWLPRIIKAFQQDYPRIRYEFLLGDYREIENWILEGRVDCGFLRLPARADLETLFLEQDPLMAVLPENHPLADRPSLPISALEQAPFLLLAKEENKEILRFLNDRHIRPDIRFTTWDDYAIMSMVESGLGISLLPRLILQRIPYRIAVRPLQEPAYRDIGLAFRSRETLSLAVKKFMEYLPHRNDAPEPMAETNMTDPVPKF